MSKCKIPQIRSRLLWLRTIFFQNKHIVPTSFITFSFWWNLYFYDDVMNYLNIKCRYINFLSNVYFFIARCHNETIKFRKFYLTEKRFRDLNFMIYFRYLLKRENQILHKHLLVNYHTYKVCVAEWVCSLTSDQNTYSTDLRSSYNNTQN